MFLSSTPKEVDMCLWGFTLARFYYVLNEFGGAQLPPITITEEHLMALSEHLLKLCEAMCRSERSACKDGVFGLSYSGGSRAIARMYLDKRYIIFKLADLRYLMNMLNFVQVLVSKYTLVRDDVRSYAASARGSTGFIEPNPLSTCNIPYYRLFDEIKMHLL
jgi:hypothetical protein